MKAIDPDDIDYPTECQLEKIRNWKLIKPDSQDEFFKYIKDIWKYSESNGFFKNETTCNGLKKFKTTYILNTMGWSGNEDILEAMSENVIWDITWLSSNRGGKHIFCRTRLSRGA